MELQAEKGKRIDNRKDEITYQESPTTPESTQNALILLPARICAIVTKRTTEQEPDGSD